MWEEHLYGVLPLLQGAFTIWMLIDAYRSGAEGYWLYVILFLPGLGAWVYFFAVKVPAWRGGRSWSLPAFFHRGPSLDELRYRVEQTPTLANQLELAERLIPRGEQAGAIPLLEAVLVREPDHCRALFLLAKCHAAEDHPEKAMPFLEKIIARDRYWSNYAAWHLLVELRDETGDRAGAADACRELARLSPTMQHQCLLAEHLIDAGLRDEAEQVLDKMLREYEYAAGNFRWRNRRWAAEGRRLLKSIEEG